jgi:hypothetical protein
MTPLHNPHLAARAGALCYIAWGAFHVKVAHDICILGAAQAAMAQGRLYQLAAYIFTIAVFAAVVGAFGNWRNSLKAYWLNICLVGWADGIWVLVVVLPGYVPLLRGLIPPAIFALGAILTTIARMQTAPLLEFGKR